MWRPTDTHQYLQKRSCHPNHVKRAVPFRQCLPIRRVCSKARDFKARLGEIKCWFKKKGYNDKFLDAQVARAECISHLEAVTRKPICDNHYSNRPLILDFHYSLSGAHRIINDLYPILASAATTREAFPTEPFISFCGPKNLKDYLVRAKLYKDVEPSSPNGMQPCDKPRCQIYPFVSGTHVFRDSDSKHTYFIIYTFNCDSSRVVYLFICKKCSKLLILFVRNSVIIRIVWTVTERVNATCQASTYTLSFFDKAMKLVADYKGHFGQVPGAPSF